ncbi:MAG: GGDEF domain-containing protein [Butyrivibrio sp.]|nr:GGDEF domain-containing protein [Butyrivibrio sp.]
MKNNVRMQAATFAILAFIVMAAVISFLGSSKINTPPQNTLVQLDSGWTISRGNETFEVDSLHDANIGIVNYKDRIVLKNTLPDSDIYPAVIHTRTILSTIDVYIGGKFTYTYGHTLADKNKMIPKMHNFIPLPEDYAGKEIRIEITAYENEAFSGLSDITFGTFSDVSTYILQSKRLSLIIGAFLCLFGFILAILSPIIIFSDYHDYSIIFSALISLVMGIYILCFNDLFWFFTDHASTSNFLEYISLYSVPVLSLCFVVLSKQIEQVKLGRFFLFVGIGFLVISTVLHLLNIVHICRFILFLHILAIVEGIFIIGAIVYSIILKNRNRSELDSRIYSTNLLLVGLLILLLSSIVDIIKFNISKYFRTGEVHATISFMTIGSFFFMLCLLLNYFYHCIEYISEATVKKELEGLAYTDPLTGISNRAKCELTLVNLKGNYTILSIDLDYLKYTNDNFGHAAGDTLLNGFSRMLKDSFRDSSLIGRMGGDEFIVILPYIDADRRDHHIASLVDHMNKRNRKESQIRFSASWGFADSNDESLKHPTAQHVYLLADKRMYSMKKQHHNETMGRLYEDLMNKMKSKEDAKA